VRVVGINVVLCNSQKKLNKLATNQTRSICLLLSKSILVMLKRNDNYQVQVYAKHAYLFIRDYKSEDLLFSFVVCNSKPYDVIYFSCIHVQTLIKGVLLRDVINITFMLI
jgi:uncharacterized protein with WD repeat